MSEPIEDETVLEETPPVEPGEPLDDWNNPWDKSNVDA